MSDINKPIHLLVDIDTILDTRLSLLYSLDSGIAKKVVDSKKYHYRKKDNFGNISSDIFNALFRDRNKSLLKLATLTPMCGIIRAHYGDIKLDPINLDAKLSPCIYLNTHPYNFTLEEMKNIQFAMDKLVPNAEVKVIALSNAQLHPDWINGRILNMYKYDGIDWLEYHTATGSIQKNPLIHVNLVIPAISNGMIKESSLTKKHFNEMTFATSTLINLLFIDVVNFSTTINA